MSPELPFPDGTPGYVIQGVRAVDNITSGMTRSRIPVTEEKFGQIVQAAARITTPRILGLFPIRRLAKVEDEIARLSQMRSESNL